MELRTAIIEVIDLLAHTSKQLQYESDVPIANVPAELVNMFCDDLYHPESELMASEFTEEELNELSPLYDSLCEVASLNIDSLAELLAHPHWQVVVAEAKRLKPLLSAQ